MTLCFWRERILLEGWMPERALLRLRRAEIPLFNVRKVAKNRILFCVKREDVEKIFAIYPNMCYNNSTTSAYQVKSLGAIGVGRYLHHAKNRIGFLVGGALCLALVMASQRLVLSVDFVGSSCYRYEALRILDEAGLRRFSPYRQGQEDWVCAKILALDGVEFCTLKKTGNRLAVEIRLSPFPKVEAETGNMQARHNGEVLAMTVLRGSPHVKIGDTVHKGDTLVEDCFTTEEGGQVRVEIIARVCIACVWEGEIEAESEEEAFAKAYLAVGLTDQDTLRERTIENKGKTYRVKMTYQAIETINL
ncbi:MAG: sporulation protein YqfD [Clostridia bacterium]|nr:sporulation protein YqfD [Clostridia bacterium]